MRSLVVFVQELLQVLDVTLENGDILFGFHHIFAAAASKEWSAHGACFHCWRMLHYMIHYML